MIKEILIEIHSFFMNISSDAIVGLFGVALGFVLSWLQQKGKLTVYIVDFSPTLVCTNKVGKLVESNNSNNVRIYSYKLLLQIYNSSADVKIMRNIRVLFRKGKKTIKETHPYNALLSADRRESGDFQFPFFNVSPKSIEQLELACVLRCETDDLSFLKEVDNIVLSYQSNRKEKTLYVPIKRNDYSYPSK